MSFVSVRTRGNFSPARNVLSTTAPVSSPLSFVRTNARPLPGLTCWNSTIRQHDFVRVAQVAVECPRRKGACVVRCIAVDRATGVDDHRLPATDLTIGCASMRPGRVGPGRNDGLEGDGLRAFLVKQLLDRPC